MIWGGSIFDHRTPLVHIEGNLTADCYVIHVVKLVVLSLLQDATNTALQQDNASRAMQQAAGRSLNCLIGYDILLWLAASADLNPIKHLWDLIGCELNQGLMVETMDDVCTAMDA